MLTYIILIISVNLTNVYTEFNYLKRNQLIIDASAILISWTEIKIKLVETGIRTGRNKD